MERSIEASRKPMHLSMKGGRTVRESASSIAMASRHNDGTGLPVLLRLSRAKQSATQSMSGWRIVFFWVLAKGKPVPILRWQGLFLVDYFLRTGRQTPQNATQSCT